MVLPIALGDGDVIGQAKTGTGKTLAFGIPLIERVIAPLDSEWSELVAKGLPQVLVVVPTRELCVQVTKDIDELTGNRGIRTLAVYGGRAFEPQIEALAGGVEIVVGTPGRLLDLYRQGQLKLKEVSRVVLDEADEMLDLGFLPDVEKIFTSTPNRAQTMLFSATMPGDIIALARRFMNQPIHIRTQDNEDEGAVVSRIKQHVLRAHALDKIEMLARILQADGRGPTIVFCRTKRTCQKTSDDLLERGFRAASIHGDLGQSAREKALNDFKAGKSDVLVATDVAARGIDIDGITHVINYQCPEDEKTYVHRIGRTARAGADGARSAADPARTGHDPGGHRARRVLRAGARRATAKARSGRGLGEPRGDRCDSRQRAAGRDVRLYERTAQRHPGARFLHHGLQSLRPGAAGDAGPLRADSCLGAGRSSRPLTRCNRSPILLCVKKLHGEWANGTLSPAHR